ncbi:MAG TPA: 23S rRNA (uracil(1939)-C(5))-methyltransferase RlmD [Casimicrobiaceae bacterium]|nr:23S rRNA (uracil(1939)-C(5))-methyltransferase RlmD [Casimicrobiaceae bacterium]
MAAASAISADTVLAIESLDQEGRGIARVDGKAIFVEGALPGERVHAVPVRVKPSFEIARATTIVRPNASRVAPRCPHFGVCGGCTLQHAHPSLQVASKQRALEEALVRIGRVRAERMLPPIEGPAWGYRFRARLTVRHVAKKGVVLVGFHERKSSFVADMSECHVLPTKISDLLPSLRLLVASLTIFDRLPQIELAVGERREGDTVALDYVLVLRILAPLAPDDERKLRDFADRHGVAFWLQTGGPATVIPFHPADVALTYLLPEFDVAMPFAPTDFTQVNSAINRVLVRRALALLDPRPDERIADFFCGLGNFTLPIARCGANVVGIEGSASLVQRAQANARYNGLAERTRFVAANLFEATPESIAGLGPLDRVLIDPPREGAISVVKALPHRDDPGGLTRIVYVSCNPATLARDAEVLVHERGYRIAAAGVVNMFPHTAHVESIALFER